MGHPVEPRLEVELGLVAADRAVGVEERLLHSVLGATGREDALAVAQERSPVAGDDHLERAVVAGAGEVDEARVALGVEQGVSG